MESWNGSCDYVDPDLKTKCTNQAFIQILDKYGIIELKACSIKHRDELVSKHFNLNQTIRLEYFDKKPT